METAELIERLGGWGVMALVFTMIARWMMRRADRALDQMRETIDQFAEAVRQMERFQEREDAAHSALITSAADITSRLERIEQKMTPGP